jgi:hypothetical protein
MFKSIKNFIDSILNYGIDQTKLSYGVRMICEYRANLVLSKVASLNN